jgi:transaldolase
MKLSLKTKIFADGAEKAGMLEMYNNPLISGFTTNPTLMKKAGIKDYKEFAQDILKFITDKPISFEIFSDDFDEMEKQSIEIAKWGSNVIVKIPITNTKAESSVNLINKLSSKGIKINATAMMTIDQVISVLPGLSEGPGGYVSIFAGRVADAGVDPVPIMKEIMNLLQNYSNIELIWASPRELFNIVQANQIGCHIITVTNDILKKLPTIGKDLKEFSLDTVKMFYNDASAAGYTIKYSSEKVLL